MIYHLAPTAQRKIWGGKKLERFKRLPLVDGAEPYGETWEISIHPDGPSFYKNKKLTIEESSEELTYLVKLIDTGDALSVQVHPGDEYARQHENSSGKSECWLILSAETDSVIYLGLKSGVTREVFLKALEKKENISEYLNSYRVMAGDFFYVPSGSIHAIGPGITMAEVQQSSGITYRVWDWNRVDSSGVPRELHINKSLDVINFDPRANTADYFKIEKNLFSQVGIKELLTHSTFKFSLVNLAKNQSIELKVIQQKRLTSILNLHGIITVNGELIESYSAAIIRNEEKLLITSLEETSFLFLE
jgi:mannose-6-phosphate isomerase